MADRLLSTYLNDHFAASVGAVELARRAAGSNQGTELGVELDRLAAEIAEDRDELRAIMEQLGVGVDRIKSTLAWTGEKLGRFKPNARLLEYSPLSRVEEIEILLLGVTGKLLLWQALAHAALLDEARADRLIHRAEGQQQRLDGLRLEAVEIAWQ